MRPIPLQNAMAGRLEGIPPDQKSARGRALTNEGKALQLERTLRRNPIFDVMLVLHNTQRAQLDLGTAKLEMLSWRSRQWCFMILIPT
jgi:hypothetical protein